MPGSSFAESFASNRASMYAGLARIWSDVDDVEAGIYAQLAEDYRSMLEDGDDGGAAES